MAAAAALQSVLPPEVGARRDAYYFTVDCDALARRGYAVRCMVADCQLAELRLVSVAPSSEPSPDDLHLPDGFDIAEETCAELLQGITRAVGQAVRPAEVRSPPASPSRTDPASAAADELLLLNVQRNLAALEARWHSNRPYAKVVFATETTLEAPRLRVSNVSASCAEVVWFLPGQPGTVPDVTGFELEVSAFRFDTSAARGCNQPERFVLRECSRKLSGEIRSWIVRDLRSSRLHKMRIRAWRGDEVSLWSNDVTATTLRADPARQGAASARALSGREVGLLGAGASRGESWELRGAGAEDGEDLAQLLDAALGPVDKETATRVVLNARNSRSWEDYLSMGQAGRPASNVDERKERMRQVLLASESQDLRSLSGKWHVGPFYGPAEG